MNTYVNPQNSDQPINYGMVNLAKSLKYGTSKNSDIFIRTQTLISDDGFIMKSKNIQNTIAFDYSNFDDAAFDEEQILVNYSINVSPNKYTYYRSYMKIQAVLASVGGLANIFRIVLVIVCYTFSIVKRDEYIMNKIFEYDMLEDNKSFLKKIDQKVYRIENIQQIPISNNMHEINVKKKEVSFSKSNHDFSDNFSNVSHEIKMSDSHYEISKI
jgi:hypothetical protein